MPGHRRANGAGSEPPPGPEEPVDSLTWRPTRQSFVNLSLFLVTLGACAAVVLGTTDSAELTGATAGLAVVVGLTLTMFVTKKRVRAALDQVEHPDLGNWPGTEADRQELRRRGRVRAGRSMAMAAVVGAMCGFYPVFGVACVGAGGAGALSALMIARAVSRYEVANEVTVMTPSQAGGRRRRMRFGVAPGRL